MANNSNTPTLKQIKFAKEYVKNGGNASKAAYEVYNIKKKNAHTVGYQNINKPVVKRTIQEMLDKNGLKVDELVKMTTKGIKHNLTYGKASQAVGADLLKFVYKLHNVIPEGKQTTTKEIRKVFIDKDFNTVKEELTQSISLTQELLNDL